MARRAVTLNGKIVRKREGRIGTPLVNLKPLKEEPLWSRHPKKKTDKELKLEAAEKIHKVSYARVAKDAMRKKPYGEKDETDRCR